MEHGGALFVGQAAPAEAVDPADGFEDERGEDVEEVGVGDVEAAVELVHAADGGEAVGRVVAVLEEFADEDVGVVVALLRGAGELAGLVEQGGDAGDGEGAEEGELEGAGGVEGKVLAAGEPDDLLVVAAGSSVAFCLRAGEGPIWVADRGRRGVSSERLWQGQLARGCFVKCRCGQVPACGVAWGGE